MHKATQAGFYTHKLKGDSAPGTASCVAICLPVGIKTPWSSRLRGSTNDSNFIIDDAKQIEWLKPCPAGSSKQGYDLSRYDLIPR